MTMTTSMDSFIWTIAVIYLTNHTEVLFFGKYPNQKQCLTAQSKFNGVELPPDIVHCIRIDKKLMEIPNEK